MYDSAQNCVEKGRIIPGSYGWARQAAVRLAWPIRPPREQERSYSLVLSIRVSAQAARIFAFLPFMLRQFYFRQASRLLVAAVFSLIFPPTFCSSGGAIAAESGVAAPAPASPSVPPSPAVTPAQARQALTVLQDEKKRAELAETLNAIALATEDRNGGEPDSPAPPAPAIPAEPKAPEAPIELTEGGLIAQLLDAIGKRLDVIGGQLRLTAHTLLEIKTVGEWWQHNLGNAERRAIVLDGLWKVAVILGGALLADWLLR
jgi:hypothetical protein